MTKKEIFEGAVFTAAFLGIVWLFGKVVDGQRDTDSDWKAYCESKRKHHGEEPR